MKTILIALCLSALMSISAGHAKAGNIKFGIQTTQQDLTYEEVRGIRKTAEDLDFYSAWNFELALNTAVHKFSNVFRSGFF